MDLEHLKATMADTCHHCSSSGLQTGNGGNISVRVSQDIMLIKASDTAFFDSKTDDFVLADFDGNALTPGKKPSKECPLHGFLYRNRPDIHAIVHCHSPWATGWSATGAPLPQSTYHSALKLKGNVPTFDSHSYAVPRTFFPIIHKELSKQPDVLAFLMKGHGQFALGSSLYEALMNAELIEETAQIAILSKISCL